MHISSYRSIDRRRHRHVADAGTSGALLPIGDLAAPLSTDQSAELDVLLSRYDAHNLSESDASALLERFEKLGLKPNRVLNDALRRAGYDLFEILQKGDIGRKTLDASNMAGNQHGWVNHTALIALSSLLDKAENTNLSADDWSRLFAELEANGHDMSRPLVDMRF